MKILHVNNIFSNFGGAENVFIQISSLTKELGHEALYFSTDKKPYFIENYEKSEYFPRYNDFSKLSFSSVVNLRKLFFNNEAKQNLDNLLTKEKPDLIIVHNFIYNLTDSIFDSIAKHKIPVVLYLHDARLFCPGGTLTHGGALCKDMPCLKGGALKCIQRRCKNSSLGASLLAAINHKILGRKKIFETVSAVVCPSKAMIDLAIKSGVDERKLVLLPHYVEEKDYACEDEGKKEYFLYCGRLDKEKGVEFLIKAMASVSNSIKLKIVGEGKERESLMKLSKDLKLDNIEFLGYMQKEELGALYRNAIATVLPCNWFETFGLTVIESFLNKTPVIGSAIGAIPELISHNKDGILVEPKNIADLAGAIKYLNDNIDIATQMGESAYNKAIMNFDKNAYIEKFQSILNDFLK